MKSSIKASAKKKNPKIGVEVPRAVKVKMGVQMVYTLSGGWLFLLC